VQKILIVDDEAHIARVLSLWLTRHGYEIREACNGTAALKLLAAERVDLIISDMNMPGLDGLGLAEAVRNRFGWDIPFLVLSARCDQAKLAEKLAAFGVRLFPKPFMPSQLVAEMERMLGATGSRSPQT